MKHRKFKIGHSDVGGIFIGKDIKFDFHKHHFISVLLTFENPFELAIKGNKPKLYNAITIQKDINYRLSCGKDNYLVFVHIDPYSENGLRLSQKKDEIQQYDLAVFSEIIKEIKIWFESSESNEKITEYLIDKVSAIAASKNPEKMQINERIKQSLQLIRHSDQEKISIKQIASLVDISPSHFARLFKKDTGITFRKFVLHYKLIKSLNAMHKNKNLTEAAFFGGFSDQAHFSRTFKNAFGIKPSDSNK